MGSQGRHPHSRAHHQVQADRLVEGEFSVAAFGVRFEGGAQLGFRCLDLGAAAFVDGDHVLAECLEVGVADLGQVAELVVGFEVRTREGRLLSTAE